MKIKWPKIDYGVCPICGSKLTATLVKGHEGRNSFRFGSPVYQSWNPGIYTCICLNCGVRWRADKQLVLTPMDEIGELYDEYFEAAAVIESGFPSPKDQTDIMDELCEENMLPPQNKKEKKRRDKKYGRKHQSRAGSVVSWFGRNFKESILSPFKAFGNVANDFMGDGAEMDEDMEMEDEGENGMERGRIPLREEEEIVSNWVEED